MEQGWGSIETLEASGETARLEARIREMYAPLLAELPNASVQGRGHSAQRATAAGPQEGHGSCRHGTAYQGIRGKEGPDVGHGREHPGVSVRRPVVLS